MLTGLAGGFLMFAYQPAIADGKRIFDTACFACHLTGATGAPKFGDKAAWAPRIEKGMNVLKAHALKGYTGNTGTMPAKGGRSDLSDDEVISGVEYMIANSK